MSLPALEARNLTKHYAGVPAIADVSFIIRPGEVLGFLGPNGSGKSTTVKMLTGLLEPSHGEVLFDGQNISETLVEYKRRLGYVPEQAELYTFLTGLEYLELVATLREIEPRSFEDKAAAMLRDLSLFPHRHSLIGSYSKGMRQRIVLIAALLHDPAVLVLDEPFSGLDVTTALVIRKTITLLAESGKMIFFSSPVLEVVEKLCTHIIMLKRGQVVAAGPVNEINDRAGLEATFFQLTEQVDADQIARSLVATVQG